MLAAGMGILNAASLLAVKLRLCPLRKCVQSHESCEKVMGLRGRRMLTSKARMTWCYQLEIRVAELFGI